jgi:hypothetical protein
MQVHAMHSYTDNRHPGISIHVIYSNDLISTETGKFDWLTQEKEG